MAGGNVELGADGFVGSDLTVAGGNITISGRVNGDVIGAGGSIYINNVINGNVQIVNVDKLIIGPKGEIQGNLSYRSPNFSKTANETTVKGVIDYKQTNITFPKKEIGAVAIGILAGFSVFKFLSLLFIGLFLVWTLRFYTTNSVQTGYKKALKSFGVGFFV